MTNKAIQCSCYQYY